MSSRARALIVGATLAAMTLAGMTAVAHAQATDEPTSKQAARRPPTQGQVGEAWHQPQEPADVPAVAGETRRSPTESQVGESWRYQTSVPGRPAESGGQLGWRIASLGSWPQPWPWWADSPSSPPPGPAADPKSGRRPDHGHAA
jgi:hypothetical protein